MQNKGGLDVGTVHLARKGWSLGGQLAEPMLNAGPWRREMESAVVGSPVTDSTTKNP